MSEEYIKEENFYKETDFEELFTKLDSIEVENVVEVSFNQESLKRNFQIIVEILKRQNKELSSLKISSKKKDKAMEDLEKRVAKNEKEIEGLVLENEQRKGEIVALKEISDRHTDEIEELKKQIEQLKLQIDELNLIIKDLKEKGDSRENELNSLKDLLALLQEKLKQLEEREPATIVERVEREEREESGEKAGKEEVERLWDELERLKNMMKDFVTWEEFNKLGEKVGKIEGDFYYLKDEFLPKELQEIKQILEQHGIDIEELKKRLGNLELTLKELKELISDLKKELENLNSKLSDKVNCEDFDRLLMQIQNMQLNKGDTTQQPIVIPQMSSTKDANKLKEISEKLSNLEELIEKLQKMLGDHINEYREFKGEIELHVSNYSAFKKDVQSFIDDMEAFKKKTNESIQDLQEKKMDKSDYKPFPKDDLEKLKQRVEKAEGQINKTKNIVEGHDVDIEELKKKLESFAKKLDRRRSSTKNTGGGESKENIMAWIKDAIEKLRNDLMKLINDILDKLGKKIELDDLAKSQNYLLEKIDEIVGALLKKCADKNETKKALMFLEKKINELYIMISGGGEKEKDIDGLLVKRPLFWSCASCDKDLDKFQGKLGDYKNWAVFPPKETSPERMGRFGMGYTRMMESRKQNIEKEKEKESMSRTTNKGGFGQTHETFPEIHTKEDQKTKYIVHNKK